MSKRHLNIVAVIIVIVLFGVLFGSRSLALSSAPSLSEPLSPPSKLVAPLAEYRKTAVDARVDLTGFTASAMTYPIADHFRISDMGPDGDTTYGAYNSRVVYNSREDEFLVVWWGEDDKETVDGYSFMIYGQRIDASTGAEIGANDFRISGGTLSDCVSCYATFPSVAYNSRDNEYLVVWWSDIYIGGLTLEYDVFGQRLDAAGNEIGEDDFRISAMGNIDFRSTFISLTSPGVAYNSTNNEYFVVWFSEDDAAGLVDDEWEIYGQRLDAASGTELGENDFRISDMGGLGDAGYWAVDPVVSHNSVNNEYLVVWAGTADTPGLLADEVEIYGQRLNAATGAEVGDNDFRISEMGGSGDAAYAAITPAIAYNSRNNEYLVAWSGDDNGGGLVNDELEIFGQRLNAATGAEVGTNDFRISEMGGTGDDAFDAAAPSVEYDSRSGQYLVVWSGDDNTRGLADDEDEIFGQFLDANSGSELGEQNFRISHMGPDRDTDFYGSYPAIAMSTMNNRYLVSWDGDDNSDNLVVGENEVFGTFVTPEQYLYLPLID